MSDLACLEVLVKYSAGAYHTQTVNYRRASSTCSAGEAVARLGRKLHGHEVETTLVAHKGPGIELWRMPAPAARS